MSFNTENNQKLNGRMVNLVGAFLLTHPKVQRLISNKKALTGMVSVLLLVGLVSFFAYFFYLSPNVSAPAQSSPIRTVFKGDSSFGIELNLLDTDKYGTGIFYTPNCLVECHMPLEIKYNGTSKSSTLSFSLKNMSWVIDKTSSDDLHVFEIKYLVNETYDTTVYDYTCSSRDVINDNSSVTKIQNCTIQESTVAKWKWDWKILNGPITLEKDKISAIDFVSKRTAKVGSYYADLVPTVYNFNVPEMAGLNSSFDVRQKVTITNNDNTNALKQILLPINYNSDMLPDFSDLRFVNGSENENLWFVKYNVSNSQQVQIWVNYTVPAGKSADLYIYYKNNTPLETNSTFYHDGSRVFVYWENAEYTDAVTNHGWTSTGELSWGSPSTTYAKLDSRSIRVYSDSSYNRARGYRPMNCGTPGCIITIDFYDTKTNSPDRIENTFGGTVGDWGFSVMVGQNGDTNSDIVYSWKNSAGTLTDSAISRTIGWHQINYTMTGTGSNNILQLDGTTLSSTETATVTQIMFGLGSVTYQDWYFDRILVRNYTSANPTIVFGEVGNFSPDDEQYGRDAIVQGIREALGNGAPIFTDQQIYIRNTSDYQQLGRFDKVTKLGSQYWAFNYVTGSEASTNMPNVSTVLYVLELSNQTSAYITSTVQTFISATKIS